MIEGLHRVPVRFQAMGQDIGEIDLVVDNENCFFRLLLSGHYDTLAITQSQIFGIRVV
jgi:hypothetical protein